MSNFQVNLAMESGLETKIQWVIPPYIKQKDGIILFKAKRMGITLMCGTTTS